MKIKRKIAWCIASPILLIVSPIILIFVIFYIIVWALNELYCENRW